MIDLSKYGISEGLENIDITNLVVLSNIEKTNIDTSFISKNGNTFLVKGKQSNKVGSYAIFGCEIVKILEQSEVSGNTQVVVERAQLGTIEEEQTIGMKFRTVVPLISPIQLINWEFNDTMGSIGSSVFPVELGTGKIEIKDDPKKWMQFSMDKIYSIKNKKSMAFLFKGVDGKCVLKNATVIEKVGFNTKGKRDPNMISINIKTVLAKWFDKDLAINQQIKSCEPKEFFQMIFELEDHDVYYADGVTADSFVKIGNMHTKEYKKISEMLKAYASCGVRFCFDRYERVKIFSDMKVKNIQSQKTLKYNITDTMMNENSLLVFNKIDTSSYERQTMFDFEELNNEYVHFAGVKTNAISSDKFISVAPNGDYQADSVEIVDEQVFSAVQLKDYVLFKGTKAPYLEVYGRVGAKEKGNKITIFPILQGDKDYKLFYLGKGDYLYKNLSQNVQPMNLHYARFDLPMIWRYSRGRGSSDSEKYMNQMLPLLPRVDGETKYETEIVMSFGSASNLEAGSYSGIIEEVNGIYGVWDNSKLLYNQEKTQFSGKNYPPIFAMSNMGYENVVENQPILFFNKFDNSNLLLEITKNEKSTSSNDGKIVMSNTMNANSLIDIYEGEELSRLGNRILQVSEMSPFKVGDILIVKNFENPTSQESKLFDEKLSKLRYRITNKNTEVISETEVKHWITLDNNFPPKSKDRNWRFQRFPVDKIVYLQELYFRGNPVIQFSQEISGFSSATNTDGDTSKDIYGDKNYSFDSKLLEKDGVKMLMGYILDHFNGVTPMTTKYTLPVSVHNGIGIEMYDVVTVIDTVFTHVGENIKWLVVGIKSNAKTNVVELSLINLNATDTKPYDIDIKDYIDYDPVEIPSYDFAGGEGETDKPNGGEGGSDEDRKLGVVALAEVKREEFRARIEKFDGNYIYFKDFSGTKHEEYTNALFPESEFAVNVDGEIVFVQSDREFRAFVKKRQMYDTEEAVITPELEVGFYVVSTMVGIDGTFYSRRTHIGDGATYFKFDPINGAHFVGDFVVGENNQHAGNDLWESLQKNKTFHQNTPPVSTSAYSLRDGDIWYDLDDENHAYRYNGDVWMSCRDKSIISTKSSTFVQPDEPKPTEGRPINDGDTWYDSDDGNKPYVYKNGVWIEVTDGNLQHAIDEAKKQIEGTLRTLEDIASDNKLTPSEKQTTKKEWEIIKSEYPKILDELTKFGVEKNNYMNSYSDLNTYITPLLSDINTTQDINGETFRTKFKNYYYDRQVAINALNDAIKNQAIDSSKDYADALAGALGKDLESQIDGKINTYNQEADPSLNWSAEEKNRNIGDLWYKPSEKLTRRWNITSWQILEAKDTVAQELANSKRTVFTEEPKVPYQAGDLWLAKKVKNISVEKNDSVQETLLSFTTTLSSDEKDSDLKVCVTTKQSGSYSSFDWKIATNYSSDSLAEKALTDANGARDNSEKVSEKVDYVVSDGVLTPAEKADILVDYKDIVNEHPLLVNRADIFRVDKGSIIAKYNDLVTNVLPVLNAQGNTDINPTVFRNYFNNYYVERNNIYDRIEKKAKELADNAQQDATTALGNAKIFYQISPPTSGMKQNDLWYDTDDGNHPYVYTGSAWISARDKIFETEGGNKVYFQSTTPPTSGVGIKDGDMWFNTGANNKMYVLLNKVWTLADDALDKVNTGRIVLNGNTTVNGDFTVRGKNIELTGETRVNGVLEVYGGDKGIISYNGTTEANSTKKIVIKGGVIEFWEKV